MSLISDDGQNEQSEADSLAACLKRDVHRLNRTALPQFGHAPVPVQTERRSLRARLLGRICSVQIGQSNRLTGLTKSTSGSSHIPQRRGVANSRMFFAGSRK